MTVWGNVDADRDTRVIEARRETCVRRYLFDPRVVYRGRNVRELHGLGVGHRG